MSDKTELKACLLCKSKAGIYIHTKGGLFRVCCYATDASYHGTDGVSEDWCPSTDDVAVWYESEAEAITAWNQRQPDKELVEALEAQIVEYESRGQVLYAGLGAPSSIRLIYDLLSKEKPQDLPAIENEAYNHNKCNTCGEPMGGDCPKCQRLWES
jgi:hypothetical protein